jgi:hypothetical protein
MPVPPALPVGASRRLTERGKKVRGRESMEMPPPRCRQQWEDHIVSEGVRPLEGSSLGHDQAMIKSPLLPRPPRPTEQTHKAFGCHVKAPPLGAAMTVKCCLCGSRTVYMHDIAPRPQCGRRLVGRCCFACTDGKGPCKLCEAMLLHLRRKGRSLRLTRGSSRTDASCHLHQLQRRARDGCANFGWPLSEHRNSTTQPCPHTCRPSMRRKVTHVCTRCCSIVLPIYTRLSVAFRRPGEAHHTYNTKHMMETPMHCQCMPCLGTAGAGASMCFSSCMKHLPKLPEDPRRPNTHRKHH